MNEDIAQVRILQPDLFSAADCREMREEMSESREGTGEEGGGQSISVSAAVNPQQGLLGSPVELCSWCRDDISRSRHEFYKTNCRTCGNLFVKNNLWVMRQEEKRQRKLMGLPPLNEDDMPALSAAEIRAAITGRPVPR